MKTSKINDADRALIDELMRAPIAPPVTSTPLLDRIR